MEISLYTVNPVQMRIPMISPRIHAMRLLGSLTPVHLESTPRLTRIDCPRVDFAWAREGDKLPSWDTHAFAGLLIYSFIGDHETELVLTRLHTAMSDMPCRGPRCIVCPMGWDDRAWWAGREVPLNVVSAAFAAEGFDLLKASPERGRTMGQKGWDVLRYWAAGGGCDY